MQPKFILLFVLLSLSTLAFPQKEVRKQMRSGNKEYRQEKYTEAEISYRKALEANARSSEAAYNLGNALYKQGKLPEAAEQYQIVSNQEKDKGLLATTWHNTGNVSLTNALAKKEDPSYNELLKNSIEAYKQSLRNNPHDDETRYNLALAQKLLKDSEDQGGGGGDDQKQDQQQDQKQDQKQDQQQQQDQQQDQQQQQQQNPQQMSKENAQQILDAMMQDEKNTQDKVKEQMKMQQRKKTDKEW